MDKPPMYDSGRPRRDQPPGYNYNAGKYGHHHGPYGPDPSSYPSMDYPSPGHPSASSFPVQPIHHHASNPGYAHDSSVINQTHVHVNASPVMTQAPSNTVIVQQAPLRPASYLALSCCVFWCCNVVMGAIAFGFSMASSSAADDGEMEQARSYGRISFWINLAGIAVTVIILVVFFTTN